MDIDMTEAELYLMCLSFVFVVTAIIAGSIGSRIAASGCYFFAVVLCGFALF